MDESLLGATRGMEAVFPLDPAKESSEVVVVFDRKVGGLVGDCTECRADLKARSSPLIGDDGVGPRPPFIKAGGVSVNHNETLVRDVA